MLQGSQKQGWKAIEEGQMKLFSASSKGFANNLLQTKNQRCSLYSRGAQKQKGPIKLIELPQ